MKFDIALPLLRSFVLLVEERNFTKVAERLRRTQPAISLQLKRLEELTGNRLFEPDTRPLQLPRHGEILLGYAREIFRPHDEARLRLDRTAAALAKQRGACNLRSALPVRDSPGSGRQQEQA